MTAATVFSGERIYCVDPAERLFFGRSAECTICLDAEDTAISRRAGEIVHERGAWWLVNRSSAHPLSVIDEVGLRSVLVPGRRTALDAVTRIVVAGARGSHTLRVEVPEAAADRAAESATPAGDPTAVGENVLISQADRDAMLALFAGYLEEPPRHDPHPRTYAAAAARLGWPRTTLVKRIEYLRTRLDEAGVPNMTGWNALTNLAEYALSRGLITKDDLRRVRRDR
ncbi:FHA domain-containing protein [Actinomadura rubrisoli]|uniref:FHA domain-containing protein n=1 Tax=Actinomadura rubrisoli TaxID=2530368 RepID=A0A4R5C380_9ACTN|nr:FHA domain-containing protein [Actinomadura rubrisoli]TDD92503.1 FHA domain-containing protein [Actinomadura rubrisoli]